MRRKFDVVIGNPPYQEEAQGDGTRDTPVYHHFMAAAYEVASKAVLITPARFLFNAGLTPKAWNEKMLNDRHLSVPHYVSNSDELFPGTDIKGGIAVTYWDEERDNEPIDTFTSYPELNGILHKVNLAQGPSISSTITSSRSFRYTAALYAKHPEALALRPEGNSALINTNTFEQFSFLYHSDQPEDGQEYVRVLGLLKNRRLTQWILKDYITGPTSYLKFKVVVAAANGSGAFGELLSSPLVAEPEVAVTQTFVTIGAFDEESHAQACFQYINSKFARAMLGILKITQHNPANVWGHVPLQNFTDTADIDWGKPISEIDQQLYAKYDLDMAEIDFIESNVRATT